MSLLERTFREQVCPDTLPEPGEGDETGDERGLTLTHDLNGSFRLGSQNSSVKLVRDIHRHMSVKADDDDLPPSAPMRTGSYKMPDPPPPAPLTDEVRASLAAASMRKASSKSELGDDE